MFEICGFSVSKGEKKQVYLKPNGLKECEIPATIICGKGEGETIWINSGVHSGENVGMAAAIAVAKEIDPQKVNGNIVIVHCVNQGGFWNSVVDVVPADGENLDRNYPGDPNGSASEKIRDFYATKVFPNIDFFFDMHSGSKVEKLADCLFYNVAAKEEVSKKAFEAAKAINVPKLIPFTGVSGGVGYASKVGVPSLIVERSCFGHCEKEDVDGYIEDIRLLLNHFQVYGYDEFASSKMLEKTVYIGSGSIKADVTGLWYPEFHAGDEIKTGDFLGRIEDIFGNLLKEYYAEEDGTVLYYLGDLVVNAGNTLVVYGKE